MDELRIFESPKFGSVRCFILDGKPWFGAVDVCKAMGMGATNVTCILKRLSADEWMSHKAMTAKGSQALNMFSESGVMNVVNHSRKPIAPEVGKWFQNEVFPALNGEQPTDTACEPDDTDSDTVRDTDSEILHVVDNDALRAFTSSEFGQVRAVVINGEPWFMAADVCKALDVLNPTDAIKKLDDDEKTRLNLGLRGSDANIVNESGLYSLVLGSRKPEAKAFKRWITHEVIPSIRKRGGYILNQDKLSNEELMARAVLLAQQTIADKTAQLQAANETIGVMAPKAAYYDNVLQSDNLLTVTQIAKCYGITAQELNKRLERLGIQYKQGEQWLPYAKYADKDYMRIVTIFDGAGQARQQTKWTQSGMKFIYDELKVMGTLPISERGKGEGDA